MRRDFSAKYLRITIHDNDFTIPLTHVADILYKIFWYEGRYPEEDEFPILKKYIKSLWFGVDNITDIIRWNKGKVGFRETHENVFDPYLEFVDYIDIPNDDNWESVYIPMFDNAEIITR